MTRTEDRFARAWAGLAGIGALDPDAARGLRDGDGVTLAGAMRQAGADPAAIGRDDGALARIGTFVELHVEQGRALEAPVGVATGIWPHGRWRLRLRGEANHAGTTRQADRRDPMLPYAAAVLAAREAAGRAGALATFGKVTVVPGGANAIASAVDGWLDVRAPDDAAVATVVAEITAAAKSSAVSHGWTSSSAPSRTRPACTSMAACAIAWPARQAAFRPCRPAPATTPASCRPRCPPRCSSSVTRPGSATARRSSPRLRTA